MQFLNHCITKSLSKKYNCIARDTFLSGKALRDLDDTVKL